MIEHKNVRKILYGGDYNPEQWDESTWKEDMRLLPLAGIDTVTLNVFNWALLQKSETEYDFSILDRIVEMTSAEGMHICMATATAAHPAWMAKKYPDILRVDIDGRKRKFGARHNSCPNSPTYRTYAPALARKLAERYGTLPNLVAWHVSNEYWDRCWCENCEKAFRLWLEKKYGSIENVNRAWNANFWGHTFYSFEEIVVPNNVSEQWNWNRTAFQGLSLDYKRFNSDSLLECYKVEYSELKKICPNVPVTTNLMGTYPELDYHKWAPHLDFVSWDNYPSPSDSYTRTSMSHAVMRGLKHGKPFALMEQTPSVTNWQPYNALKRPLVMRLWSYQAVAQGADTVMFFQMRRSRGACEKFHGAVIDHCGHENTRVFREVAALGKELSVLSDSFLGSRYEARAAILFDWDTWWALGLSAGPSVDIDYPAVIHRYYDALCRLNVQTDIVGHDANLSRYSLVAAPLLYMVKPGLAKKLETFTERGGAFVTTCLSGLVNETDLVTTSGYPGELRSLLGIWVEETDALLPGQLNGIEIDDGALKGKWDTSTLCDIIHCESAKKVGSWTREFYKGTPALTRNAFGKGEAWYVGGFASTEFLTTLFTDLAQRLGIPQTLAPVAGVEVTERTDGDAVFVFILNHNDDEATVTIPYAAANLLDGDSFEANTTLTVKAKDILLLRKS